MTDLQVKAAFTGQPARTEAEKRRGRNWSEYGAARRRAEKAGQPMPEPPEPLIEVEFCQVVKLDASGSAIK